MIPFVSSKCIASFHTFMPNVNPKPPDMSMAIVEAIRHLVINLTSDYDLQSDPIHKHFDTNSDDPTVSVLDLEHRSQRPDEAPAHLWPHNAALLGRVPHQTTPADRTPAGNRIYDYFNDFGEFAPVYYAFNYT